MEAPGGDRRMIASALPFPVVTGARPVRMPVWRLVYAGRDITREISPMARSVTYTDHTHGESDVLELEMEDKDGRWRGAWYPEKGDAVELWIGYLGEPLLPCGQFAVDDFTIAGPPDVVTIRALAAGPIPAFRTRRSNAYEGQTLQQIAEAVGARYNLTLVGTIEAIHIERATQVEENDLSFLARLAESYGYVFSIRGDQLIFYQVAQLDATPPTWTVRPDAVSEFRFKSATRATYRSVDVSYHDPVKKELVTQSASDESVKSGDTYKLRIRAEDAAQALTMAKAMLTRLNRKRSTAQLEQVGAPRLVAGSNGQVSGWGRFDGTYQVENSIHRVSRDRGYTTGVELVGLG